MNFRVYISKETKIPDKIIIDLVQAKKEIPGLQEKGPKKDLLNN